MIVFLTGGTGYLGKRLIASLHDSVEKIYVLSRYDQKDLSRISHKVVFLKGDLTGHPLILDSQIKKEMIETCTHVIHAGAAYDITDSKEKAFMQNVFGIQNLLAFIKEKKFPALKSFYHISSVAIFDPQGKKVNEDDFLRRDKFDDHYSMSKYYAEKFLREMKGLESLSIKIIRPGIIIADSVTGQIEKKDGPYYFMNFLIKNKRFLSRSLTYIKSIPLPFNPAAKLPLIPVDHCAQMISLLLQRENQRPLSTYHLVSPHLPSLNDLLTTMFKKIGIELQLIPVSYHKEYFKALDFIGIPKELAPFFYMTTEFDINKTLEILPELNELSFDRYAPLFFSPLADKKEQK